MSFDPASFSSSIAVASVAVTLGAVAFGAAGCSGPTPNPPYLTSLDVTSTDTLSVELTPAFSPNVHDYYVQCAAGQNSLTVSMAGSNGAMTAIEKPQRSAASNSQSLTMTVNVNEALVVTASLGSSTTEYWVRCLPPDMPLISMQTHPAAGTPAPGYYIIGNSGGAPGYAMIVDGNGVPVWYYESTAAGVDDVDDVVPGAISFFSTWTTDPVSVRHLSPAQTTTALPSGSSGAMELDSHELRVLPNGDYLVFSYPLRTGVDLSGLTSVDIPAAGVSGTEMFDCVIVEFDPTEATQNVKWTWTASDHFDPNKDSVGAGLASQGGVIAVDAYHCNSIDIDPTNGNLLVSSRNMNSVFYVDRSTGKVVWKMGGAPESKDGATYVPIDDPFIGQHDARLQGFSEAKGTGQISVFDDETNTSSPARGLLLDVTTGVSGATPRATVAWQYKTQGNSVDRGSFRIESDGTRVIGWGQNTTLGLVFTELDAQGNDLMEGYFPINRVSYRAIKVPLSTFDLSVLRATAGLP